MSFERRGGFARILIDLALLVQDLFLKFANLSKFPLVSDPCPGYYS